MTRLPTANYGAADTAVEGSTVLVLEGSTRASCTETNAPREGTTTTMKKIVVVAVCLVAVLLVCRSHSTGTTSSRVPSSMMMPTSSVHLLGLRSSISSDSSSSNGSSSNSNDSNDDTKKTKNKSYNFADRVQALPLYEKPLPAPQWSGFLNASASTPGTYLHYYMAHYQGAGDKAESDEFRDDPTIPVIFFFNGGPGASSLVGLFTELGPLLLDEHGTGLVENPYAYTHVGHLVVLESPAGVGFSFCQNWTETSPQEGLCLNNDVRTAQDAHAAIRDFYTTKFPALRHNPLYLTGESYAGVYVPTLAQEILEGNAEIDTNHNNDDTDSSFHVPLVGLGVSDGCTDNDSQKKASDTIWYAHKYGFITDAAYHTLHNECNLLYYYHDNRGVYVLDTFVGMEEYYDANPYNYDVSSCPAKNHHTADENENEPVLGTDDEWVTESGVRMSRHCQLAYRKFMLTTSMGISGGFFKHSYINQYASLEASDPDYDEALTTYMNRQDVQLAMNMVVKKKKKNDNDSDEDDDDDDEEVVPVMKGMSTIWPRDWTAKWWYEHQYDACNPNLWHTPKEDRPFPGNTSMIDIYREVIPKLAGRTLFSNGDNDPSVSYEGSRLAIEKIGFDIVSEYRPWFLNLTKTSPEFLQQKPMLFGPKLSFRNAGVQYGGSIVTYKSNLSFMTVHGAGHMTPEYRPRAALHILKQLVKPMASASEEKKKKKPKLDISPALGSDSDLVQMNEADFIAYVSEWTKNAHAQEFIQ